MELDKAYSGIEQKFYDLCTKIVTEQGLKLYDMEYLSGQKVLRVFIMDEKTGTAVIDDCAKVDRAFNPYFEEEEWLPELTLEVSSPGMFRTLKTSEHFQGAVGEIITVNLKKKIGEEGNDLPRKITKNTKLRGYLREFNTDKIKLEIEENEVEIEVENIKKANLDPDF